MGWVELHRRAGNPYAEQFLTTSEIHSGCQAVETELGTALIPAKAHHIWHGLVHHHFGHRGFARGRLELKGLYEFAYSLETLDHDDWQALITLAARSSLAWASFQLWCAACIEGLSANLPEKLSGQIAPQAHQLAKVWLDRWETQEAQSGQYPGYRELIDLAGTCEPSRRQQAHAPRSVLPPKLKAAWMLAPKLLRS